MNKLLVFFQKEKNYCLFRNMSTLNIKRREFWINIPNKVFPWISSSFYNIKRIARMLIKLDFFLANCGYSFIHRLWFVINLLLLQGNSDFLNHYSWKDLIIEIFVIHLLIKHSTWDLTTNKPKPEATIRA